MSDTPGRQQPPDTLTERNLCVLYGDHEECPYTEVDERGQIVICLCPCHLDPDSRP